MKNKIIVSVGVLVVILAAVYYFYIWNIDVAKAKVIIAKKARTTAWSGMSDDFIITWARSLRLMFDTFTYKGHEYRTSDGKATDATVAVTTTTVNEHLSDKQANYNNA